ncbi:MAG: MaoC/PaaZ C-terminal domain-containing protein [Dehalococcoidia bacterium]|nr:MaoC/PaaZ C-terminal domain-containing protein [Dehalococcoidia bacterium]
MTLEYYEDIKLHERYRSRGYLLTEQKIVAFGTEWDPDPLHIDSEFAGTSTYGGLIAPGALLIAIFVKLIRERESNMAHNVVLGWDEVRFLLPGRPGDTLVAEMEVTSKRESKSDPSVGIAFSIMRLLNQRDEPVITFKAAGLIGRRPKT